MSMPSLKSLFIIKEELSRQHWSSNGNRYNVEMLYKFAEASTEPEEIPVESLVKGFYKTELDEPHWSDKFVERAQEADLSFPILVAQDNKKRLWVVDGNHRLGKAIMQADEFISGYIVQEKDLPEKAIEPKGDDDDDGSHRTHKSSHRD